MKFTYIGCLLIVMLVTCCGCNSVEKQNIQTKAPIVDNNDEVVELKPVSIVFAIRADFPGGEIQPDRVQMDGKAIVDSYRSTTGMHKFTIEKAGYKTITADIMVKDPENSGIYYLNPIILAKERIVYFNITDKESGEIIAEPKVTLSIPRERTTEEIPEEILSDGAYTKPGVKKLVIQKLGYKNLSDDIAIQPDENPYVLEYQMEPLK